MFAFFLTRAMNSPGMFTLQPPPQVECGTDDGQYADELCSRQAALSLHKLPTHSKGQALVPFACRLLSKLQVSEHACWRFSQNSSKLASAGIWRQHHFHRKRRRAFRFPSKWQAPLFAEQRATAWVHPQAIASTSGFGASLPIVRRNQPLILSASLLTLTNTADVPLQLLQLKVVLEISYASQDQLKPPLPAQLLPQAKQQTCQH